MREEDRQALANLFQSLSNLFRSISPYAESVRVYNAFKSFLNRAKELYYVEVKEKTPELSNLIDMGYKLLSEMPKCMSPTQNCRNEHNNWGLRVQELTYKIVSKFKEKGIDFGYSEVSAPFKLDEENLIKIGLIVVGFIILSNLLKR